MERIIVKEIKRPVPGAVNNGKQGEPATLAKRPKLRPQNSKVVYLLKKWKERVEFEYLPGLPYFLCWNFRTISGTKNRVELGLSYRPASVGILEQSMRARNRVGIGLSYRPSRLHA